MKQLSSRERAAALNPLSKALHSANPAALPGTLSGALPCSLLLAALAVLSATPGRAADAPVSGGTLLQQVPARPAVPAPKAPRLQVAPGTDASEADSAPFMVNAFVLEGNTVFGTEQLQDLLADSVGKNLGLAQLRALVQRISAFYQSQGYSMTRAVLPAQPIDNGVVRILVVEARLGQLSVRNSSSVDSALVRSQLSGLHEGQLLTDPTLDRSLMQLSDVPGVAVSAELSPGALVGQSDLLVMVEPAGQAFSAQGGLDNAGNASTGELRLNANLSWVNLLGRGDTLNLSGLSAGKNMNYAALNYDGMVGGWGGARAGFQAAAMQYDLGGNVQALRAHGTAQVWAAWFRQMLVRGVGTQISAQLQADQMRLQDNVDASDLRTHRHVNGIEVSLAGLHNLPGRTDVRWNLALKGGQVGFDDAAAERADAATAQTQGTWRKVNLGLSFNRALSTALGAVEIAVSGSGQWSGNNLDTSQKLVVGGPRSVRAYAAGALAADSGGVVSAELRRDVSSLLSQGWLQAAVFVDHASVRVNRTPWAGATDHNKVQVSGAGMSLAWSGSDEVSLKVTLARVLGTTPVSLGSVDKTRAWLEVTKRF